MLRILLLVLTTNKIPFTTSDYQTIQDMLHTVLRDLCSVLPEDDLYLPKHVVNLFSYFSSEVILIIVIVTVE